MIVMKRQQQTIADRARREQKEKLHCLSNDETPAVVWVYLLFSAFVFSQTATVKLSSVRMTGR
jgi:hypothetical protein